MRLQYWSKRFWPFVAFGLAGALILLVALLRGVSRIKVRRALQAIDHSLRVARWLALGLAIGVILWLYRL